MTAPRPTDGGLLQWPRIAYLVIGALLGAIAMELMRRAGW